MSRKELQKILKDTIESLSWEVDPCKLSAALSSSLTEVDKSGKKYPELWKMWTNLDKSCLATAPAVIATPRGTKGW